MCTPKVETIRALNDEHRRGIFLGKKVLLTGGVMALPLETRYDLLDAVRGFDKFPTARH